MAMTELEKAQARFKAGQVFTPGSPINERDLFAGRLDQVQKILNAASQTGYHAVLYGERGVGKTSLSNVLASFLNEAAGRALYPRVNCDASDTFTSVWKKAFKDITLTNTKKLAGFSDRSEIETRSFVEGLPAELAPDDIRRLLAQLSAACRIVITFDEFDRIEDRKITLLMADTIKNLSDYAIPVTILIIGVADSVDALIDEHHSIERSLVQIPMPRMSVDEIMNIVNNGLTRLGMSIRPEALLEISEMSQGLPYITHLLSLHTARKALDRGVDLVEESDLKAGIALALEQWQQSIKSAYYDATRSQQPGAIYREVLLACAMAEIDDLGYFSAASVRVPLRVITQRDYDIPNFARHLKELSETGRGQILQRTGEKRRIRYRFTSPIMCPYIVMRGFQEGLIDKKIMRQFRRR